MTDTSTTERGVGLPTLLSELGDLVVAYLRQRTIAPLKGLLRFLAFGLSGSFALGFGLILLLVAILRLLQDETGTTFTGDLSWLPYVITAAVCLFLAGAAGTAAVARRGDRR
ncbi:MAG: hypothetical protein ACRDYD_13835 [Acidimicrobiales bacterium]